MISPFLFSQFLAAGTFICDIISWQFKDRRKILSCLILASTFYGVHFYVLNAYTGAALSLLAVARFITALRFSESVVWSRIFILLGVVTTAITYQTFVSIFGGIGTIFATFGSFHRHDKLLRIWMMLASLCWILHNLIIWTPVGVFLEGSFLVSNLVGYFRYYKASKSSNH